MRKTKEQKEASIKWFQNAAKVDRNAAIAYLEAEEWIELSALETYKLDKAYFGENLRIAK